MHRYRDERGKSKRVPQWKRKANAAAKKTAEASRLFREAEERWAEVREAEKLMDRRKRAWEETRAGVGDRELGIRHHVVKRRERVHDVDEESGGEQDPPGYTEQEESVSSSSNSQAVPGQCPPGQCPPGPPGMSPGPPEDQPPAHAQAQPGASGIFQQAIPAPPVHPAAPLPPTASQALHQPASQAKRN